MLCTGQHPDPQKPSLHTSNNYSAKRRSPQQDLPQLQNIFIKSRRGEQNYEKINQSNHRSNIHRSTHAGCSSNTASTTTAAETTTATATEAAAETTTAESADAADTALADGSYTIGINQFAVHGSLDNCREGFLEGLAENGIVEGKNLTVLEENAQADPGLAAQISTNFAGQKVDLICAIATPSAQSAYSVGRKNDIPVIYTAVTDPVAAELANADGTPVGK